MNDAELETAILNRLQEKKHGQTIEQLSEHLKRPHGVILPVLHTLRKDNCVTRDKNGVWTTVIVK